MEENSDGSFGESFGQRRPPLYEMIKNILREYPSGQIFKEVIQNADDARATEVKFFLDCRRHETLPHTLEGTDLSDEKKQQFTGQALLSYNNAAFKKEDWESIQSLYQSGKAKNPHKVGKFGIGFNSVYHVTDIPVILSQDYCGFLEPQEQVWKGESGRGFYLSKLLGKCPQVLDQFDNICGFSKSHTQFNNKTLLRFPLRTGPSHISNETYTIEKLRSLLEPLKEEVAYLLVFLRSVVSIEISQINTNGTIESIFKVSIDQQEIAQKRRQLVQSVETTFSGLTPYSVRTIIPDISYFTITLLTNGATASQHEWLVVNQVGSNDTEVLELAEKQHVLPWVGTAIEMNSSQDCEGRIFCVLPLPVEDRAPFRVHVNGTFAVSSNRRSLQWEAQERQEDEEGTWNKLLVSKCIPSCYVSLITELMTKRNKDSKLVYSCWPNLQRVSHTPWAGLLQPFYSSLLRNNSVVYTPLRNGQWISVNSGVFIEEEIPQAINDTLLQCNVSLVKVDNNCTSALQTYHGNVSKLTPSLARAHLKGHPNSYTHMSRKDKITILKYCLKDGAYNDVISLHLLPLANGKFQEFQQKHNRYNSVPEVYLCASNNPSYLLPGLESRLVSVYNEDSTLHSFLAKVAAHGQTQLTVLGVTQVANMLSHCSTSSWSDEQLKQFWQWLNKQQLAYFHYKPIVPVKIHSYGRSIVPLAKEGGVIYVSPYHYSITSDVISGLNKCSIKFADAREFNYLQHSQLTQFLYQFEPSDVLDAIHGLANINFTSQEAVAIQNLFSSVSFSGTRLSTICTLPLFCTLQNSSSVRYSINSIRSQYCNNKAIVMNGSYDFRTDLLPSNHLLISSNDNNNNLLLRLTASVEFLTGVEFLQRIAFTLIKNGQFGRNVIPFMKSVLDNFYIFQRASSQFKTHLQSLPFIETRPHANKVAPCTLYDPESELLKELFYGQDKFPGAEFHPYLAILRQCGLQSSVSASVLLEIVQIIRKQCNYSGIVSGDSVTYTRVLAVMKYITACPSLLLEYVYNERRSMYLFLALAEQAKQYCWLPIATSKPLDYPDCLTWKGASYNYPLASTACTPLVTLSQDINSSHLPMIVGSQAVFIENVPDWLTTQLNRSQENLANGVVTHFLEIIENESELSSELLQRLSLQTYDYLLNNNSQYNISGKWIWMENLSTFIEPSKVAIKANPSFTRISLEPFIFILPTNLAKYSNVFTKYGGVCEQVTNSQIISVLHSIKSTDSSTLHHEEAWSIVKAIIDWVAEDETRLSESNVLVPVESSSSSNWPQLLPLSDVVYTENDMLREIAKASDETYYLIHPKVSYLSSQLRLTPLSDHLDITEDVFDDAGQHEPLITRLSNILREYKDGLTIIKEMIQNADDAGATEVNILYDNCNHSTDNLLFKGMAESHGPALIVHNNSTFTDEDFVNITKLAGATKANQPLKIGKFGVGFCSVYHITDVPSFVSGEWLYIFDPTLKHLKGIIRNENRPGKKIKYQSQYLTNTRQLIPYEGLFDFSSSSTYNGTMFRLPFRTCTSEISSTIYNRHTITQMMNDLKSNGSQLLLFLRNVKKITFSTRDNSERETQHLLTIECTNSNDNIRCITNSSSTTEHWLMSTHNQQLFDQQNRIYKPGTASVACQLIANDDNSYNCQPLTDGAVFCFLPLAVPSTGLPVHVSANFAVMSNRSGIWTGSTGLAADSREQWNQQLMETVIPTAYCNLLIKLKEIASTSGEIKSYDFHCLWPLEVALATKHPWDKLIQLLYQLLSEECLFHSISTSQWLKLAQSQFLPSSLFHDRISMDTLNDAIVKLKLPVVSLPGQILEQLQQYCKVSVITEYEFTKQFLTNITLLQDSIDTRNKVLFGILSSVGFDLSSINISTDNTLLDLLKTYPCVPCSPEGINLEFARNLVDPFNFQDMFDPEDGKFPLNSFNDNTLIRSVILKLGLMSTDIPWNIIVASAETVVSLFGNDKDKTLKRVKVIIKSISEKSTDANNLPDELKKTPFLPVLQKPDIYILPWKGEGYHILPPCQVIAADYRLGIRKLSVIVGSQTAIVNTYETTGGGCGPIPKNILKALGISSRPLFDHVLIHLQCLIDLFQPSMCEDSNTQRHIEEICRCVYEYLEESLNGLAARKTKQNSLLKGSHKFTNYYTDEVEEEYTGSEEALSDYNDKPFIWTGQEFARPCDVAKNWKRDGGPYLYKIPNMLSERKTLLKCLQVVDSFTLDKLLSTLHQMYVRFSTDQLAEEYHTLIDDIMLELHSMNLPDDLLTTYYEDIILSDDKYCLHYANQLTFNDAHWLPVVDEKLVHPKVTRKMAEKFGVNFTSTKFLDQFTSSTHTCNFHGIPFGQREELTRRISNILRDYPLDVTFLKELLQNADDAKATKMCVILDKRTHGKVKLLSEEWKELQGPAVLVWNDKEFSDKDLEGIQKLGLGSKRDDHESIGQFGIGFNVVYHLTDCPSFITRQGNVLCVFDPHCKYVPGADVINPGRQYNSSEEFWSNLPDLKDAYLRDTLTNQPEGLQDEGVLFRFPLRSTKEQIMNSELVNERVKTDPLTAELMEEILDKWVDVIKDSLLFLNHIIQFEFYVIDSSNKYKCKKHFKVHITDETHQKRVSLKKSLANFKETKEPVLVTYPITIESSIPRPRKHNWFVQQGVGDIQNPSKTWKFINQTLPKHGIAASLENREHFLGQVFCFLPLPVYTDLPVHINGQFALNSNRRSLWSSSTEKPDDRAIWNDNLIKAIASSYVHFLQEAKQIFISSEGYKEMDDLYNAINAYYSLFPFWNPPFNFKRKESQKEESSNQPPAHTSYRTHQSSIRFASQQISTPPIKMKNNWMEICTLIFELLWSENANVLSSEQKLKIEGSNVLWYIQWHELHNDGDLINQAYFSHSLTIDKELRKVLRKLGMILTCAPVALYKHLESNKPAIISMESVYEYYTKFHCKLLPQACPCPILNTPFETVENFCLFLKYLLGRVAVGGNVEEKFSAPPGNTPLLLTADTHLRSFQSSLVLCSKYSHLFKNSSSYFIHRSVLLNCTYISPSYFTAVENVTANIIDKIMLENYSHELRGSLEVDNSNSEFISLENLEKLWACLNGDPYFKQHQEFIVKNWALIPSCSGMFYRASSPILPLVHDSLMNKDVFDLLVSFGFPVFKEVCPAKEYCVSLSQPAKVLSVLYHLHSHKSVLCKLPKPQNTAQTLFTYFREVNFNCNLQSLVYIKSLPLFMTVDNEFTTIQGKDIYLWPIEFCKAGYDKWAPSDRIVFLERNGTWTSLVGGGIISLGGQDLNDREIYGQIIFSSFGKLTPQERKEHLQYIKDHIFANIQYEIQYCNKKRSSLASHFLSRLKNLLCLEAENGILRPVNHFADHTNPIFTTFSDHFHFVPEEYQGPEWLEFLRGLDLRVIVEFDEFRTFCNEVARGTHTKIISASNVLMSYLFSDSAETWHSDTNYLSQIGNISFVIVDQLNELQWIKKSCQPPGYNQDQRVGLTRLNEAVVYDSAALIWTVKPVVRQPSIPSYMRSNYQTRDQQYLQLLKRLGLTLRPNVDDVFQNLKNISQTRLANFDLFHKYDLADTRDKKLYHFEIETAVITPSLNYLFECNAVQQLKSLSTIPCIPVSAKKEEINTSQLVLVKPIQIVRSIPTDCTHLFPYVHTLPSFMTSISHNLEDIGIYQTVNINTLQHMLQMMYERFGDSQLDPNNIVRVREAIFRINSLCKDEKHTPEMIQELSPLYYPNSERCLCNTEKLVFVDSLRYKKAKFHFSQTPYSLFELPPPPISSTSQAVVTPYGIDSKIISLTLPKEIRPKGLSLVCSEEIFVQKIAADLACPLFTHFQQLKTISQSLSTLLPPILKRYVNVATKYDEEIEQFTCTLIEKFVTRVVVIVIEDLRCHVKLLSSDQSVGIINVPFMFQINEETNCTMYVDPKANIVSHTTCNQLVQMLCIEIARIHKVELTTYFKFIPPVCECIRVQNSDDLQPLLERYEINSFSIEESDRFDDNTVVLGKEIPESMRGLLDLHANHIFYPEEWVGYEAMTHHFVYAIVLYPLVDEDDNIYTKKYRIMIGESTDGTRDVSGSDLYKLISERRVHRKDEEPSQHLIPVDIENPAAEVRRMVDSLAVLDLKRSIYTDLLLIWRIRDEDERRKALKRLYLSYHPDKHPENAANFDEAFKYLKKQIDNHDEGRPIENPDEVSESSSPECSPSPWRSQQYNQWNEYTRGAGHTRSRNRASRGGSDHYSSDTNWQQYFSNLQQPQINPQEAKRWLRQAQSDLEAMRWALQCTSPTLPCQVLFLAHEATEKALKAGMYHLVGLNPMSLKNHDLSPHANAIASQKGKPWDELPGLVCEMEKYYLDSRYPNRHTSPIAPVDLYTLADAQEMATNAEKVLKLIHSLGI